MKYRTKLYIDDLSAVGLSTDYLYAVDSNIKADVTVDPVYNHGDTIATITVNGTATEISAKQIDVDDEISLSSANPILNAVITQRLFTQDYTAFEVFPTDKDILSTSKTVDSNDKNDPKSVASIFNFENKTATGLTYKVDVPACMTLVFDIKSYISKEDTNVIIDFGDNQENSILDVRSDESGAAVSSGTRNDYKFRITHEYAKPGKYTVKIYGNGYYCVRNNVNDNRLLSRCFDSDLPIASFVSNMSSFGINNLRLLKIDAPLDYFDKWPAINCGDAFSGCKNLQYAYGLKYIFTDKKVMSASNFFRYDENLIDTDFVLPLEITTNKQGFVFQGCKSLTTKIENLIPASGFSNSAVDLYNVFADCLSITGTVPKELLWENTAILWRATDNKSNPYDLSWTFRSCSDAIRALVPVEWGGTNTSIKIPRKNDNLTNYSESLSAILRTFLKHPDKIYDYIDMNSYGTILSGTCNELEDDVNAKNPDYRKAPSGTSYKDLEPDYSLTSVNSIGKFAIRAKTGAFCNCKLLKTVELNNLTAVEQYGFYGCSSLSSVHAEKLANLGSFGFTNCSNLISLDLPELTAAHVAFNGCTNLTSFSAEKFANANGQGGNFFGNDTNLVSVYLPKIESLGLQAFYNCKKLTELDLPSLRATALNGATLTFINCTSLSSVNVPNLLSVGSGSFINCSSLSSLNLSSVTTFMEDPASSPKKITNVFGGTKLQKLNLSKFTKAWILEHNSELNIPSKCAVTCSDGELII